MLDAAGGKQVQCARRAPLQPCPDTSLLCVSSDHDFCLSQDLFQPCLFYIIFLICFSPFLPLLCSSSNSSSLHLNITFSNPLGKHTPSVHNTLLPWLPFCNMFPVQSDGDHSLPFSLSACVLCWDSSRHASRASWRCAESISTAGREPG